MTSYGKVYRLGMREVACILDKEVYVEEKVDGSQFSFGVDTRGGLWCRSRSKNLDLNTPDQLFFGAVQTARSLHEAGHLDPGTVYRGEAMRAPRHNKLTYKRVPKGNLALFEVGDQTREELEAFTEAVGLECVPLLGRGRYTRQGLADLVSGPSFLGGTREGIVIKQACGGPDRLKAKLVCESFRESKPKRKGPIGVESIVDQYRTEARWDKAIQHLTEVGELADTPKDIPKVMREISRDLAEECEDEIRAVLWPKIWKEIVRGVSQGAAEHYLRKLGGNND